MAANLVISVHRCNLHSQHVFIIINDELRHLPTTHSVHKSQA